MTVTTQKDVFIHTIKTMLFPVIYSKHFDEHPADRQIKQSPKQLKEVTEPFYCKWVYNGQQRYLYVPVGYRYDGASIPRIAWTIIGIVPSGPIDAAALAHDAPYRAEGGLLPEKWFGCKLMDAHGNPVIITRKETDWVFRQFGLEGHIKRHRIGIAHKFVRVFGQKYWGGEAPSFS